MSKVWIRIKNSRFYKDKLEDTKAIALLKKGKRGLSRVKGKIVGIWKKEERFPRMLPLLEQNFYEPEAVPDYVAEAAASGGIVDVIIPIYNGYSYLEKLFQDLPEAGMPCRFWLVDDKSPDERVHALERFFVEKHPNALLLENEENLGFVKSVNRGLKQARGHVALVNTDTELSSGWLARLMLPILRNPKVGSTTPYTNSGTIFSFPNFCYNNPIYRGLSVDVLDGYFKRVKPGNIEAPTGVGFCMGMNREAIARVGLLDAEKYTRGFGEENDWCQRAVQKGFHNVQVENLFVYHKHGGSFVSEEKQKLIESHKQILARDYPNYDAEVVQFIRRDKNRVLRQLLEILIDTHETKSILFINHCLGGGATKYLNERKAEFLADGCCVSTIAFNVKVPVWTFTFENNRGVQTYECWSMEEVLKVCGYFKFDELYVNELVSFAHLWDMQKVILKVRDSQTNCRLIMLMHDYFAICPSTNLMDGNLEYCGMPDTAECEQCYARKGYQTGYACPSRKVWVQNWKEFLKHFDEVRCFSGDTLARMKREFGDDLAYTLVPHQVSYLFPIHKTTKTTETLNIGLLGVFTVHKGGEFVKKLLKEIEDRQLPVRFRLLGRCEELDMKAFPEFSETGLYRREELVRLIFENDIDLFLLPSVCPETFSYTAEEIMKMGMPVATFDLGAPAERIRDYDKGLILRAPEGKRPMEIVPAKALEEILAFAEKLGISAQKSFSKRILYVAEYISFSSRYRLEHLREELLCQGVDGELTETRELEKRFEKAHNFGINWNEIGAVVIYRCRYMGCIPELIAEARKHKIRLVYDIDDYIFDYAGIRDLPFFHTEEYKDFEAYSELIHKCMEQMDGFLLSTDSLAAVTALEFPGKATYINRNAASAEMVILSNLAMEKKRCRDTFIMGYYSGSNTHNRDFELIEDVLLEFMKAHSEVRLKVVGCLELGPKFDGVKEQVIREGFMDWRRLPESIAEVDCNLMPLEDTIFQQCKSENKWMEAALVGVPTIGSMNRELEGATRQLENIILCRNAEEWRDGLERLLADRTAAAEIAARARDYVLSHKTTLQRDQKLLDFVLGAEK